MSTTLCGHARPYDLCHECEEIRYRRRVVEAAREYECAWDRYANPSRYPDAGSETDRILAKAVAHQTLLDAVRADGAP